MPKTPDEVANAGRQFFADAHELVNASSHPKKAKLQQLLGGSHALAEKALKIVDDNTGSGEVAFRAGDDKD